jgi:RimJ/RimL family protein N-acetyltransferase
MTDVTSRALTLPIETPRLRLRDFRRSDTDAVRAFSDEAATRFMFYGPRDEEDATEYIERMLRSQRERPRLLWELAIVERASERVVGACDLTLDNPREADLGYILASTAWGRGLATEAARAMVRAGFAQLGLDRIYGLCEVTHSASSRVLEKAGLRHSRTLAGFRQAKGRSWDMHLHEVQRAEWTARVAEPQVALRSGARSTE